MRKVMDFGGFVIGVLLFLGLSGCSDDESFSLDSQLKVDGGLISGTVVDDDPTVTVFKGIPYAAAPVGDLRWKAPQEVVSWEGVKECNEFGPSAIQAAQAPFMMWTTEFIIDTSTGYSEDCLSLNIWTDNTSTDGSRPVIVYLHGGGFNSGGSSCEVYWGEEIAKKGAVYVSINYRVGVLGFLCHPDLKAESEDGVSGNYGILDQIAALKWVKKNISKFGGDPGNVTIQGQSAGSGCVTSLMMSPKANGLFHRAVAESMNYVRTYPLPDMTSMETSGKALFGDMTLADMRNMSTDDILALRFSSNPCVDGVVIPKSVIECYKEGLQNDVPLMTGMTSGDTMLFGSFSSFMGVPSAMTVADYMTAIEGVYGDMSDECLAAYPAGSDVEALSSYASLMTDDYMADQYFLSKARALKGKSSTYMYYFTRSMPGEVPMGAFHTADVPYFLNYFSSLRADYWTETDYDLGDKMSSYLVNFAESGNPNGEGLPEWNAYDGDMDDYIELGDTVQPYSFTADKQTFWDAFGLAELGLN